ncbi:MAG: hypothetical protein ACK47R_00210, partial [Planctomycetia bacterium]
GFDGVISFQTDPSNGKVTSDDDWFTFTGNGLAIISVDTDEFSGNFIPVIAIWSFDPQFYRPQRITSYINYTYNEGTYSLENRLVVLPEQKTYFIEIANAYSAGSALSLNGAAATPSSMITGHYRLKIIVSNE